MAAEDSCDRDDAGAGGVSREPERARGALIRLFSFNFELRCFGEVSVDGVRTCVGLKSVRP